MITIAPPTAKQIQEAARSVRAYLRRAVELAADGAYGQARADAERAERAAHDLKELLGPTPGAGHAADAGPYDSGASNVKHRLLSALRQGLGVKAFHVSNSGIGPAAWATLIVDGPYYVDITVRAPAADEPLTLGGFPLPAEHDAKGWHDLAVQRARLEGIPFPSEPRADTSARDPS